jgi:hypothetical protein
MTFASWNALYDDGPDKAVQSGAAVLLYQHQYGTKALAHAREERIAGHVVPTVNLPYMNSSEYLERLARAHPEAPFVASYFRRLDGMWQFSLRSLPGGADVSEIAKRYGGGGHKHAAGFETDENLADS